MPTQTHITNATDMYRIAGEAAARSRQRRRLDLWFICVAAATACVMCIFHRVSGTEGALIVLGRM